MTFHGNTGIHPWQRPPTTILTVGTADCQFTSVKAALDFAATLPLTLTTPVAVVVAPGLYVEAPFSIPNYVVLISEGGWNCTILQTTDNNAHFITLNFDSRIQGFVIEGPTGVGFSCIHFVDETGHPGFVEDIVFHWGYYGILCNPIAAEGVVHLRNVGNEYLGVPMHTFIRASNRGIISAVECSYMCGAPVPDTVVYGFAAEGDAEIYMDLCSFRAPGTTTGVYVNNGATVRGVACVFSKGHTAIQVGPLGASFVSFLGTNIRPTAYSGFTWNIKIDSALATVNFSGQADTALISVTAGANFTANFSDNSSSAGIEGFVTIGELWNGANLTEAIPIGSFLRDTASTGGVSGLGMDYAAGLNISVDPGEGYINTGTGVVRVTSTGDVSLPMTANAVTYVYVDDAGVIHTSGATPASNTIHTGLAYANATDVVWLSSQYQPIANVAGLLHDWIEDAIGSIWVDGLVTAELTPPSVQLTTSGGSFWIHDLKVTVGPSPSPAVFCSWWFNGASWVTTPGLVNVDVANYNTGGALAAIPGGKSVKHAWWVGHNGSGPEYHLVYAQQIYDNAGLAAAGALPIPPAFFPEGSIVNAGIVCSQGTADIVQVTDENPRVGVAGSASSASSDHSLLLNLNVDSHLQYALLSGNAARNPVTGEFDFAGGTITVATSAAPTQTKVGSVVWDTALQRLTVGNGVARKELLNRGDAASGDLSGTYPAPTVVDLHLAGQAQGDVVYYNGANWVVLPTGVDGQQLITRGPAANPEWQTPYATVGNGLVVHTGAGVAVARTLTGTANRITVADGSGVAGNPTIDVGANVILTTTVLGGDLSGSLPNATVAKVAGTTPGAVGLSVLASTTQAQAQTAIGVYPAASDYMMAQEQRPSGTAGGTFTNGWQTRNLNTTVNTAGTSITRAGTTLTLAAGTYYVEALAVAFRTSTHKVRIRNTTAGTTLLAGSSSNSTNANNADVTTSSVMGTFTVGAPTNIQLQHYATTTRPADGFGLAVTSGEVEVYSALFIERIA